MGDEKEEWRPFETGTYEVSSFGRVRRAAPGINTYVGRILRGGVSTAGYRHVSLFDGTHRNAKHRNVHKMVAEAFLGKAEPGLQVNHIDGNKLNNRADNLEYVTASENMKHAIEMGLYDPSSVERTYYSGDEHWTRKNPHSPSLKRGDENGSRLHPEAIWRGEQCVNSALTEDIVRELRVRSAAGESYSALGREFGVTHQTVRYAVNGHTWRHVK